MTERVTSLSTGRGTVTNKWVPKPTQSKKHSLLISDLQNLLFKKTKYEKIIVIIVDTRF